MIRREIWWRNAALIIAMVIFGLWHKASMLFVIWGCYHGVLLVLHRQLQQLHRKLNWQTSSGPLTFLSWLLTVAVISFGWIFSARILWRRQTTCSRCCFAHLLCHSQP